MSINPGDINKALRRQCYSFTPWVPAGTPTPTPSDFTAIPLGNLTVNAVPASNTTIPPGAKIDFQLGYSDPTPWFQTKAGNVYIGGDIFNPIPMIVTGDRYFSLNGANGYPGILTHGTLTHDLSIEFSDQDATVVQPV